MTESLPREAPPVNATTIGTKFQHEIRRDIQTITARSSQWHIQSHNLNPSEMAAI
jgi:hypothetical protein